MDPGRRGAFEELYGPEGEWVRLFRRSPAYRGTELLEDLDSPNRFVTIDRWGEQLTLEELPLGRFRLRNLE